MIDRLNCHVIVHVFCDYNLTTHPKVICEEHVATRHGRKWIRPLRVLLSAQYTHCRRIQLLSHGYTLHPHGNATRVLYVSSVLTAADARISSASMPNVGL